MISIRNTKTLAWVGAVIFLSFAFQNCSDVKFKKTPPVSNPQVEESAIAPPQITTHPAGGGTYQQDFTMFVIAAGDHLQFQWLRDDVSIPGETNNVLILNAVVESNNGVYTVKVKNEIGTVKSNPAVVNVHAPASVTLAVPTTPTPQTPTPAPSASCLGTTLSYCNLGSVSHGSISGICVYGGSCSYTCKNGSWSANSNNCAGPASCASSAQPGQNGASCLVPALAHGKTGGRCDNNGVSCPYKCNNGKLESLGGADSYPNRCIESDSQGE